MISVLLLEKVLILSKHLEEVLNQDEEIKVLSTFTDGHDMLNYLKEQTADVVVIDPLQANGLVIADEVMKKYANVKVIGFSAIENPSNHQIISLGASYCLSKHDTTLQDLIGKIKH